MIYQNYLDMVGNTPIVRFESSKKDNIDFFIKLEGYNPTGSVKDRAAKALILEKIEKGELVSGKTILDASSGSFATSIALLGKILDFPVTVTTGGKMTKDKIAFLEYFGAHIIPHGNFTIEGNEYCRNVLVPNNPEKFCFLDQLHNWRNSEAHYQTTGPEILSDIPDVSAIAFSLGSGGTLHGISRYIKEKKPDTKIIAVTAGHGTKIPGTGAFVDGDYVTPFIADSRKKKYFDFTAVVGLDEAIRRVKELRKKGFYVGIQTGAVYQGMLNAINELQIEGKVLVVSGDSGWKNMDKLIELVGNG